MNMVESCTLLDLAHISAEIGKKDNGDNGTKELHEMGLKCPKMMNDQLCHWIKVTPHQQYDLAIAGFVVMGLKLRTMVMDRPSTYNVCRIQKTPALFFPSNVETIGARLGALFGASMLPALHIINIVSQIVQSIQDICNDIPVFSTSRQDSSWLKYQVKRKLQDTVATTLSISLFHFNNKMKDNGIMQFVIPYKHRPGTDLMTMLMLQDTRTMNLILRTLIGRNSEDKYIRAFCEWIDGSHADVLYVPKESATEALPSVLVEVQNTVDKPFIRRIMKYCSHVIDKYHLVPPIALTICIHDVKKTMSDLLFETPKAPYLKKLPSDCWAQEHFFMSKATISGFLNTLLSEMVALGYVLTDV